MILQNVLFICKFVLFERVVSQAELVYSKTHTHMPTASYHLNFLVHAIYILASCVLKRNVLTLWAWFVSSVSVPSLNGETVSLGTE